MTFSHGQKGKSRRMAKFPVSHDFALRSKDARTNTGRRNLQSGMPLSAQRISLGAQWSDADANRLEEMQAHDVEFVDHSEELGTWR